MPAERDDRMPPNKTAPTIQLICASVKSFSALMYGEAVAMMPKSIPYNSPPNPATTRMKQTPALDT